MSHHEFESIPMPFCALWSMGWEDAFPQLDAKLRLSVPLIEILGLPIWFSYLTQMIIYGRE